MSKTLEDILKAVPNFVALCVLLAATASASFTDKDADKGAEVAAKAVWAIVPLHLLILVGQSAVPGGPSFQVAIAVALLSLVILMAIGGLVAILPFASLSYKQRFAAWTASILVAWFFTLLAAGAVAGWFWWENGQLRDIGTEFDALFDGFDALVSWLVLTAACSAFGVAAMFSLKRIGMKKVVPNSSLAWNIYMTVCVFIVVYSVFFLANYTIFVEDIV